MRYFRILNGKFKGEYEIYESKEELLKHKPYVKFFRWNEFHPEEIEVGNYVEALDGVFLPLLSKSYMKNKRYITYMLRFPNGTFAVRCRNDKCSFTKFYGLISYIDQYSLSKKTASHRFLAKDSTKAQFAGLIAAGYSPLEALNLILDNKILNNKYISKNSKFRILTEYLLDEDVMEHIKQFRNNFLDKLKENEKLSDEAMIKYITDFIDNVRKGSETHLKSIYLLLRLTQKLPEDFAINPTSKKETKTIEEIPYVEIEPDKLNPPNINSADIQNNGDNYDL